MTGEIPIKTNKTNNETEVGFSSASSSNASEASKASAPPVSKKPNQYERPSIWQLALPSILGNLSYTVVGMVQTKFVGELGPQALSLIHI